MIVALGDSSTATDIDIRTVVIWQYFGGLISRVLKPSSSDLPRGHRARGNFRYIGSSTGGCQTNPFSFKFFFSLSGPVRFGDPLTLIERSSASLHGNPLPPDCRVLLV